MIDLKNIDKIKIQQARKYGNSICIPLTGMVEKDKWYMISEGQLNTTGEKVLVIKPLVI